jgi:hypothetical protein
MITDLRPAGRSSLPSARFRRYPSPARVLQAPATEVRVATRNQLASVVQLVVVCSAGYVLGFLLPVLLIPDTPNEDWGTLTYVLRLLMRLFVTGPVGAAVAFAIGVAAPAWLRRRSRAN